MAKVHVYHIYRIATNPSVLVALHQNPCLSDLECLKDPFSARFCLCNILRLFERYVDVMELDINSTLMIPMFTSLLK